MTSRVQSRGEKRQIDRQVVNCTTESDCGHFEWENEMVPRKSAAGEI